MNHYINNFIGSDPVCVNAMAHATCGPLVTIRQNSGSCHFQHSMTPIQAREMAIALMDAASEMDEVPVEEVAA
jgi:hypothetical protein